MTRRIELLNLAELQLARRNPKDHDLGELMQSIRRFGFVDAVILDERTGRLISGHGRLEALRALFKEAPQSPPEGVDFQQHGPDDVRWLVPVQRGWSSKNDTDAEALLVAVNRLVELGGWNDPALDALLVDLARTGGEEALEGTGYDAGDVDRILRELAEQNGQAEDDDTDHELEGEPYVKAGELWLLGSHRLLVGDNTNEADVARLLEGRKVDAVIGDPPYAIYGSSTGIGADIADDKMVRPFFERLGRLAVAHVRTFGHVYLCTDWRSWAAMWEGCRRAGLQVKGCLVWDKGDGGMGSMWAQCYELIGFFALTPPAKALKSGVPAGQRKVLRPNILRYPRPTGAERLHNAAKPVRLMGDLVEAATDAGGVVLDPYCGSGPVLIACEQLGRTCLTLEIEPKTAQKAIERWQRLTGRKAELVQSTEA